MTGMGWLSRLIRMDTPEDPKRLVLILSATGLAIGFMALAVTAAYRVLKTGDIGSGAVGGLVAAGGPLAGLAGFAHKKSDGAQDA